MLQLYIEKGKLEKLKKDIDKLSLTGKTDNDIIRVVLNYNSKLEKWKKDLIDKLSDKLDIEYWHSPRDPSRYFTYKNTGKLIRSIKSKTEFKQKSKSIVIHSWIEIGVPYATYLNYGMPLRKDGKIPNWVGFGDDLFFTHKGRQGLKSVLDLFDELVDNLKVKVE